MNGITSFTRLCGYDPSYTCGCPPRPPWCGEWHKWRDIPVIVTYHPSYLLRPYNQNAKRESWEDLKKVLHYVYD